MQILRYGRCLNQAQLKHADVKFFLHCSEALITADKAYREASKDATDWSSKAGKCSCTANVGPQDMHMIALLVVKCLTSSCSDALGLMYTLSTAFTLNVGFSSYNISVKLQ